MYLGCRLLPVRVRGNCFLSLEMNRFHLFPCTHQTVKVGYMQARHTRESLKAGSTSAARRSSTQNAQCGSHPRLLLAEERRLGENFRASPGLRVLHISSVQPVGQHGLQRSPPKLEPDPRRCDSDRGFERTMTHESDKQTAARSTPLDRF